MQLRPLETARDYRQFLELQRATWGSDFTECVPVTIPQIVQKVGGVAAGAFDESDRMLGFVFGVSGMRDGRPAHWSHMLAVHEDAQGAGLGMRLKLYQRELLLDVGIEMCYWTYDPLVAQNAHLNINRLGARPAEYVIDMYGDTNSELHSGLGTDRFIAAWELRSPTVEAALTRVPSVPFDANELPVANGTDAPDTTGEWRVEIPESIQTVKRTSHDDASRWRRDTRNALTTLYAAGRRVTGFYRDAGGRCFYVFATETADE